MSDDGDDRTRSSEDDMVDTIGGSVDSRADDVVSRPSMAPSLNRPPSAPPGQTGGGRAKNSPTDLSGLKTNTIDVNPYLKGQLVRDPHGDHVFKGRWSMRFADFEPGPGPMSDFELKHKSMDPEESDMFPFSGSYTGWYKMKETTHGSKETRVEEKDVMIIFKKNSGPDSYNVDGFGRNQFGQYKIVGLLSRATQGNGTLELFRIYVPGAPGTAPPPPPVSQPQGSNRPRAPSRPSEGAAPKLKSSGSGSKVSGGGGGVAKAKQPAAQAAGTATTANKKKSPSGSHTPSLSTSGGGVPGRTLSEKNTRRCLSMVKELREKNKEACAWFLVPVDERMAPGYSAVIKQPMDFGTIETKLKSKPPQYSTVQEVAADVRLIFKNSMTFNGPDTPYYQDAETLNRAFNEIYKRVCAELKIAYNDGTGVVTTTARATPKKKQPEPVGPRPPPAPQYQLPTAHMADADMYSNPMVDQYRKKVHELSAQVVELESENSMLKLKLQQAENRNRLLEDQLGISTAPPPSVGVHHSHSHGHSHTGHSHHAHATTSVHAGSTASSGGNSPKPRAAPAPAPPPAPAVPVATAADRSRLEELIGAISESEDSNLMSDLCGVLEQYGVGLNADGELLIDVNGFDDHTVRALLDWCEPYFVNDQESAGEQSGSAGHQEKEDEDQPMEDQNTEEMAVEESTGTENGHVVARDEGDGEEEAGEPMDEDSEPAAVTGVKRGRPADLDTDDTANKKVRAEAEEEPEVEPESETVKAAEPAPGSEGGATQTAPKAELVNGTGEEEEEDDVGLQEDGEEDDSPAAGAQAPVNALNKWLSSGGDGDDDDEGAAEEAKEPSGAGAWEGEGSELWEQARQMKQQELEREKERLEEELLRRAQEEEAERKRREAALEEQRRMQKERLEEEEKARKAKEEEEEKRRKKLEEARMQARMQRQQA